MATGAIPDRLRQFVGKETRVGFVATQDFDRRFLPNKQPLSLRRLQSACSYVIISPHVAAVPNLPRVLRTNMQTLDLKGFQQALADAKSVVILMPENPSLDVVASATCLSLALGEQGKEAVVACPSAMVVEFNRLVGVQKVTDAIENRNLTVSFEDYEATNIERVSYNIENGRFMLVVAPKAGVTAPNKDQIILGYRGVAGDLVIVLGAPTKESLGKFAQEKELFSQQGKVVLINTVPVAGFPGSIELVTPGVSSLSETVMQVVEGLNFQLNADMATNLFAGLRSGSDNFQKVTADTFASASRLMNAGARLDMAAPATEDTVAQAVAPNPTPVEWTEDPKIYKGTSIS